MNSSDRIVKTVLLTGATGFLGSHLLEALLKRGYRVIALKRSTSRTGRIEHLLNQAEFIDIDRAPMREVFEKGPVDSVIHTACSYGRSGEPASTLLETNVAFPLRLLELAAGHGVEKFLNTDTILPSGINGYSLSKAQFVEWLRAFSSQIRILNLRFDHIYGPGDDEGKFVTWLLHRMLSGNDSIPLTEGKQERDFIFIDDVVNAFLHTLEMEETRDFTSLDAGTGKLTSVRDFVLLAKKELEAQRGKAIHPRLDFGKIPYRQGESMEPKLDLAPIRSLGWNSRTGLEEGLEKTIQSIFGGKP